jgi:hypothetical protein
MRRLASPLIVVAVIGFAIGTIYRYLWDDPNEASPSSYLRSGAHGMVVAATGWGIHLCFSLRGSGWLRKWPLLAQIALRAVAMAIAVAAVIAGSQVVIYDQPLAATWLSTQFPGIFAIAFVSSVIFRRSSN